MPELFATQCKKLGFHSFDASGLSNHYQPLTYKTQLNESNFDFLSRILEEAGISYYYQHNETQHILKLIDNPHQFPSLALNAKLIKCSPDKRSASGKVFSFDGNNERKIPSLFSWSNHQTLTPLQTRMSPLNNHSTDSLGLPNRGFLRR